MDNPLRFGVVGTSFISDWMLEALSLSKRCTACAIFSRDPLHADAYARGHGIPGSFSDFAAFLESDTFDAVYLASPNYAHYPQAMAALEHGKHVLCEKPLALNRAQAEAMIERARERGLVLMEAIRPLHDPFLPLVRAHLPEIGRVRSAEFSFCQYSSRYDRFKAGEDVNIFNARLGNAALLDLGVYALHVAAALFGFPARISAAATRLSNGTEVSGLVLLDYGRMQASVAYSKVSDAPFPSHIQGENGSIAFDTLNAPTFVHLYRHDKSRAALPYLRPAHNMVNELEDFARCVCGEDSSEGWNAQSLFVMEMMDEIRRQTRVDFGAQERL